MQNISVTCPHCETRFQLQADLLGKRMRCPNAQCREVFLVQDEAVDAAAPTTPEMTATPSVPLPAPEIRSTQISGSVGELVPILAAEPVLTPAPADTEPPAPLAAVAPMPAPPIEPEPPPAVEAPGVTEMAGPVELAAGSWEAPPVRHATEPADLYLDDSLLAATETSDATATAAPSGVKKSRRRNLWLATGLLALLAVAVGVSVLLMAGGQSELEEKRQLLATQEYDARNFGEAARLYHYLQLDFPESPNRPVYHFMSQLASLREPIHTAQADPAELMKAVKAFLDFLQEQQDNPLWVARKSEAWETLTRAADDLTAFADVQVKKDARLSQELLGFAQAALAEAAQYPAPKTYEAMGKTNQAQANLDKVQQRLNVWKHRRELLDLLELVVQQPTGNLVERSHALIAQYAKTQPDLAGDTEVLQLLAKMPALQRAAVKYHAVARKAMAPAKASAPAHLFFVKTEHSGTAAVAADQKLVFALADGVLYACAPDTGKVHWVLRLGLDCPGLPQWLPASPTAPPRLVTLAPDRRSILAVEAATGTIAWEQELSSPCLGHPVLLGTRAFVALQDGRVEEVDTATGRCTGYFQLGQPLTGWGVAQPGSSLLYVPGDHYCIYALDVDRQECVGILYSKHAPGSLRGQPILGGTSDHKHPEDSAAGLLLLAETVGMDQVKLRSFALPLIEGEQKDHLPAVVMPGWTWFGPHHDPERLALITDAGRFQAFGIGQPLSHDVRLFPWFQHDLLPPQAKLIRPKAEVVLADGNSYWVLAGGKLFRLLGGIDRDSGPKLQSHWEAPLAKLGSPLQPGQVRTSGAGEATLFLLTQDEQAGPARFSAVATPDAELQWRKRLGLKCDKFLTTVAGQVLAVDSQGTAYLFDPSRYPESAAGSWLDGATLLADEFPGKCQPLQLLTSADPNSVTLLSLPNGNEATTLQVRKISAGPKAKNKEWSIALPAPLAGSAALADDALVVPLANGSLLRYGLTSGTAKTSVLNWRSDNADPDAAGHVVWLGGDDYLVTDGSRGLRLISWPAGQAEQANETLQLDRRLVAAPQVVAWDKGKATLLAAADADQVLTLLRTVPLQIERQWSTVGIITAGPFVVDGSIGCILDQQHLHWWQPDQAKPAWKHSCAAPIVGEPRRLDKGVLIADTLGNLTLLDPKDGASRAHWSLTGNAAPMVAPVAWTKGHVFAPLTDGTVVLLKIE